MPLTVPVGGVFQYPHHGIDSMSVAASQYAANATTTSGAVYPTADLALYVPIRVKRRVVVVKLHVAIVSASGNVDLGIYDAAGTRLVSTGTTAAAAGLVVDITDTTIGPGIYYYGLVADNTTATLTADSDAAPLCATYGILTEQLGAGGTLPTTATWAVNQTLAFAPFAAFLLEPTVA